MFQDKDEQTGVCVKVTQEQVLTVTAFLVNKSIFAKVTICLSSFVLKVVLFSLYLTWSPTQ